jgi:hypothetical protein
VVDDDVCGGFADMISDKQLTQCIQMVTSEKIVVRLKKSAVKERMLPFTKSYFPHQVQETKFISRLAL